MLDLDGDGQIDEKELAELMGMKDKLDKNVMKYLIGDIDGDRDNKINIHEFKLMI